MVRTITIGVVSMLAVVGVLGAVFAVGLLRIRLADTGAPSLEPARHPSSTATRTSVSSEQKLDADQESQATWVLPAHSIELPADKATLTSGLKLEKCNPPPPPRSRDHHRPPADDPNAKLLYSITGWRRSDDWAEWTVTLPREGSYEVDVIYASAGHVGAGVAYVVSVGDKELTGTSAGAGGRQSYQMATVGNASFPAGQMKVRFRLTEVPKRANLALRGVRLIPAS